MVKAKFGALALTVLMGLGAVSPLHGVTEAHALNAPVPILHSRKRSCPQRMIPMAL